MAYIDHGAMVYSLSKAWESLGLRIAAARKICLRRLRVLEADKNAETEILENQQKNKVQLEYDLSAANVRILRLRRMKTILESEKEDDEGHYDQDIEISDKPEDTKAEESTPSAITETVA